MIPAFWGITAWYQSLGIRIPRELGCGVHTHGPDTSFTAGYKSLGIRIPRTRWGMGLDHTYIVHLGESVVCDLCTRIV